MIVYGDLLFLINFSMDFLCFYFTCLLLHKKLPTLRACISSAAGGAYSVAALFFVLDRPLAIALDVLVMVLMCLAVLAERGLTPARFLLACVLYFIVSATLGGVMTALFSFFNGAGLSDIGNVSDGAVGGGEGIDAWIFALLAVCASVLTLCGGRIFRSASHARTVTLEIRGNGGVATLRALVDSGNLACEPISGRSVIFATVGSCREIVPMELYEAMSEGAAPESLPAVLGVRLVPSSGIGGRVLLPALRFPELYVHTGRRKKCIDAYVAFVPDGTFCEHDAIISDGLLV